MNHLYRLGQLALVSVACVGAVALASMGPGWVLALVGVFLVLCLVQFAFQPGSWMSTWLGTPRKPEGKQPQSEAGDKPVGRVYENAKELRSAYIELALHTRIDPRRDAQVSALIWKHDMDVARATLEQIKEEGTWPLYSYRLLSSPLAQKPVDNIRMLLDEGAWLCRYDDQFNPTIFQSWQSWTSAPLCVPLLDTLLGAGLGINDEDIEGRNLLDVIMADFKDVSHIGAAIPSTTRIHGYLDAIQAMIERGALLRSDYPQRVGECAKKLACETDPRMLQVMGMLQARLDMATLDDDTPKSQERGEPRRL